MAKKVETKTPVSKPADNWQTFLHWVYCPDGPGKCTCDKK